MKILLAGRAAEDIFYHGFVSLGASDDLRRASMIAKNLYLKYGYQKTSEDSLLVKTEDEWFNQKLLDTQFEKIKHLVDEQYQMTKEMVQNHREQIKSLADFLLEKETLGCDDIAVFFDKE